MSEEIEVGEMEVWSVPSCIFHLPFRRKLERDSLSYDLITLIYDPDEEHFCKFILKQHVMCELVFELFDLIVVVFFEFD